jgi:hypothetical protein
MTKSENLLNELSAQAILSRTPPWKHLRLRRWTSMSPKASELLADRPGNLELPDLVSLSSAAAAKIGKLHSRKRGMPPKPKSGNKKSTTLEFTIHGYWLNLPKVRSISPQAAHGLAQHIGSITLNGKVRITASAARELARYRGCGLSFTGTTQFSAEVLKELAQYAGPLNLDGIRSLTTTQAEALSECRGYLSLRGVRSLSVETAKALARIPEEVHLGGIRRMTDEVAEILGLAKGRVILFGLQHCTDRQYQLLAAKRHPQVPYPIFEAFDRTP